MKRKSEYAGADAGHDTALARYCFKRNPVRCIRGNEFRVVAKDVAISLGYRWKGISTIRHVPEIWRGLYSVQTPSGEQEMLTLTEQGVYFFVCRSDKPDALAFQMWLAGEVLPSIQKTGGYHVNGGSEQAQGDWRVRQIMKRFSPEQLLKLLPLTAYGSPGRNGKPRLGVQRAAFTELPHRTDIAAELNGQLPLLLFAAEVRSAGEEAAQ